jgi:hypothetical protein
MMRLLAWALMCLVASVAHAQETTGDIRGRLQAAEGRPIGGATVTATSPNMLGVRRTSSAADGVFQFRALPPGTYSVRITMIGHAPMIIDSIAVQLGRTSGVQATLAPTSAQLAEVRIAAPSVTLDPARTTIGATLETSDYALLPGTERDYKSLIAIVPHVNTSYYGDGLSVGGSTGLENMYFIDGVNVTSPLDAATSITLPANFIRSVEVRAGGYEAEYGRALGAIINAVTYSGTNEFEANIFGYFTHDAFAMAPRAQPTLRETGAASYDVGARISGPVMRDRLWFSAAWNPRIEQADRVILGQGTFQDRRTAQVFAGKLTWQPNPAHNIELSAFGDPTVHNAVSERPNFASHTPISPDPFLDRIETGAATVSLKATSELSSVLSMHAAVGLASGRKRISSRAENMAPFYVDHVYDSIGGSFGFPDDVALRRISAALRGTLAVSRHTTVAGVEYEQIRAHRSFETPAGGVIFRNDVAYFVVDSQATSGAFHNRNPTAYLQDSWRASDRLTLNLGVRWSSQVLISPSGRTAQRMPDEWQPRAGFSWQVGKGAAQRVFGSYGRFFQQTPLNLSTLWYADYYQKVKHYSIDPRLPNAVADSIQNFNTYEMDWARSIPGVQAENFDEFSLGYERVSGTTRFLARAIRRQLRSSFQWGFDPSREGTTPFVLGTPGEGEFDFLPPPRRDYTAFEIGLDGAWRQTRFRASYVLSRTWGNYSGLFSTDQYVGSPGGNFSFWMPHQADNSTGYLPNDRTHVVKLVATRHVAGTLTAGLFATWHSGAPLNEFGAWAGGPGPPSFVSQRGSAGRAPAIWEVNLRVASGSHIVRGAATRVVLDILRIGNPRTAVRFDQQRYELLDEDGRQVSPNRNYLKPIGYQSPMAARLGIEIGR